jgi:hypothetical protein
MMCEEQQPSSNLHTMVSGEIVNKVARSNQLTEVQLIAENSSR